MREENLVNMRAKHKLPLGSGPQDPGHPATEQSHSSAKVTIFHLHWIKSPWRAKLKCWSPQRIFKKLSFFLPPPFLVHKKHFPHRSLVWHQGRLAIDFHRNMISSASIHYLTGCVIGSRWGEAAEDTGLGMEMSQYVKLLLVSLCLLFLFFLQGKQKINLYKEDQVLCSDSLLASASWHLLWHCSTLSPVQGQPSEERGTAHMMMVSQGATRTSLPHLQPGCCQGSSFWVGNSPASKNHGTALVPGSHHLPTASPCLLIFHFDSLLPVIPVINKRCWGTFDKCMCLIILYLRGAV